MPGSVASDASEAVMFETSFRRANALASGLGLTLALLLSAGCTGRAEEEPVEASRLTDSAGVLSREQRSSIEDYLGFIVSDRGIDYRVVVVDTLRTGIEREAVSRYQSMAIGSQTDGKGLLLLVDVRSREARVEIGYELEYRVRDVEASSMIRNLLAPYFASGDIGAGIEASVERLVEVLESSPEEPTAQAPLVGSGGGGATEALLEGIDSLTPETKVRLQAILVPQERPEDCVKLEMALMRRGIYYQEAPIYDQEWRKNLWPSFPPARLRTIARDWEGPFEIERVGDHAIAYRRGEKSVRIGPQFLRKIEAGWIIDASSVFKYVVYDYSNHWFLRDGDYPYLPLVKSVYAMQPGSSKKFGKAWMLDRSRLSKDALPTTAR